MLENPLADLDLDAFFKEWDEQYARQKQLKKLRKERPWTYEIIRVLYGRPNGSDLQHLYRDVWAIRYSVDLPKPKEYEATVRSCINHHTRQSSRWNGKAEDDLFYSPRGRGSWAVHHERAAAWLRAHALPDA
ncbi:hypothetical protein [Dongia sp.]|uniref:hypothetical protein n=1 Tax=Dongia sp. TaxID=1977262 RepID=UPI0037527FA3